MRAWLLALVAACGRPPAAPPPDAAAVAAAVPRLVVDCPPLEPEENTTASRGDDALTLTKVAFADLPGWADDHLAEAVPAFLASCDELAKLGPEDRLGVSAFGGRAADWRSACAAAAKVPAGDDAAARAFFEAEFTPYAAAGQGGAEGKMSGYFVQSLRGSRTRHDAYQTPMLARPPDLVSVELSSFIPDGRARRIWGRFDPATGSLVPYATRAELRQAPLDESRVLVWVDDAADAVFAEIEGSAKVALDDGGTLWLAFAGKNGHPFRGVGGILQKMGVLEAGQSARAWLHAHPERVAEIADHNPAKVFFAISPRPGAVGRQGAILTPRRSLAVDRAVIALSTPVWIDTNAAGKTPWRHLLVAQDTGGAILGTIRGDIYWGDDEEAAASANRTLGPGRMWLLLPRGLKVAP